VGTTGFIKLNADWNAEPNAPHPEVTVMGEDLILEFDPNHFLYPRFSTFPRVRLVFSRIWRYRVGTTNDHEWYSGGGRFSGRAPQWGEFYEVTGDLRLEECQDDWIVITKQSTPQTRHFLFYFRDEEFECDAHTWRFEG
jgi:hypothetical protein